MKTCHRCDTRKEATEFHKDNKRKDGLQVWCKECRAEYDKQREKVRTVAPSKVCRMCDKRKTAANFSRASRSKDGLHAYCKTCFNKYQREWYHKNKTA